MTALHEMTALDQAAAVRAGEVSPTELTTHYLERIQALDPAIGAYLTVVADRALEQAARTERERPAGPLSGVPVAIKDVVCVENVRCTHGSATRRDQVSDLDDHVVTRLRDTGAVIIGTTNTPEFALPCYTENRLGPPTRNPWDPDRSPGGSSGGSAAAVAARLAPVAHGTDAGGSIRIPGSACGLVGLKPSRGRISDGPAGADVTGLSVHGALARTVADAAAMVDAMAGLMPGDTYTAPPTGPLLDALAGGRWLRIASMPEPMLPDVVLHPDCRSALDSAVKLLLDAGHQVDELEMSPDPGVAEAFARTWSVVASRIDVEEGDEHLLTPFTRYLRGQGNRVTGPELHEALTTFRGVGQLLADMFFAAYDVILTPTLAQPPVKIGAFSAGPEPADDYARMAEFMPYTPLANITGLPSVTLPLHWNSANLPIGVLLTGRYGDEPTLLALAAQLEEAAGQTHRRPPIE